MRRLRTWWSQIGKAGRWRVGVLGALLLGAIIPTAIGMILEPNWPDLLVNFGTGMAGTFLTFILIDMLMARYEAQEQIEKQEAEIRTRLIQRLGSSINDEARRAAEEMRRRGWLTDGSLEGVELVGANLEGVDLRGAWLRGARLFRANLKGAWLYEADLSRAYLTGADLSEARMGRAILHGAWLAGANMNGATRLPKHALAYAFRLKGATLPDGSRYDGCYCLHGDLQQLKKQGKKKEMDVSDPAAVAAWYGVETAVYEKGQRWADAHLTAIREQVGAMLVDSLGDGEEETV
jgi:hypothetical protein